MMLKCEVRHGGQWVASTIEDALGTLSGHDMRCTECHGQVRAHKAYNNGVAAHFEHYNAHAGCSQISSTFSGVHSPHPNALK